MGDGVREHAERGSKAVDHVHDGAFRSAEVRAKCAVCGEATDGDGCLRCGLPLCAEHRPAGKARCAACEETLAALRERIRRHPLSAWMLALSLVGTIGLFLGAIKLGIALKLSEGWLAPAAFVAAALPLWISLGRRALLRRSFRGERPGRRRLHAPIPPIDPPVPRDQLASGAFVTSLFFFLPFLPALGLLLGIVALVLQRRRRTTVGRRYAIAAVVLGTVVCALQASFFLSL